MKHETDLAGVEVENPLQEILDKEALHKKRSDAAKKGWATRRENGWVHPSTMCDCSASRSDFFFGLMRTACLRRVRCQRY